MFKLINYMLKTTIGFIEMNTMYFHILTITIIYIMCYLIIALLI